MDQVSLENLLRAAPQVANLRALPTNLKKQRPEYCFEFEVPFGDAVVKLEVQFKYDFPLSKPSYLLKAPHSLGFIPHVERNGSICYSRDEDVVLDTDNPAGIVSETLEAVLRTLKEATSVEHRDDFLNEFESYWGQLDRAAPVFCNLKEMGSARKITVGIEGGIWAVMEEELADQTISILKRPKLSRSKGLFIPLERPVYPFPYNHIFDLPQIRLLLDNARKEDQEFILEHIQKPCKSMEVIVFCQKQPNGFHSFFGFKFSKVIGGRHPLLEGAKCTIRPIYPERIDEEYLIRRGGSGRTFNDKKGLVIGCGSVGGFIATELVRASILKLTVVDGDTMRPENCYRHCCGMAYLGENKAKGLAAQLEKLYPHAQINPISSYIDTAIRERAVDFANFDFVVVATGNPTANMDLSEYLYKENPGLPLVFSWLDPYGVGGHCLVTNSRGDGCYRCLYDNDGLLNSASFASPSPQRPFSKSVAGCASTFTPYGSLDANELAVNCVRTVLESFNRGHFENEIRSWKGDPSVFVSEGYQLSDRFFFTVEELKLRSKLFSSTTCKYCKHNGSSL